MKTYEATGKNYEDALQHGLNALHATFSDVTVETLEEGSSGLQRAGRSLLLKALQAPPVAP